MKACNVYKPGTAKYYRDQLANIWAVSLEYDGYNKKNAKQMAELIKEMGKMAKDALGHKKLYVGPVEMK